MDKKKEKMKSVITVVVIASVLVMGLVSSIMAYKITTSNPNATPPAFPVFCLSSMFESVAFGIIFAQIIPFMAISRWVEKTFGAEAPDFKFILLNSVPIAIINGILVNMVVSLINIVMARTSIPKEHVPPFMVMWLPNFLPLILPGIVVCYIVSVAASPIVYRIYGIGRKNSGK